MKKLLKFEDLPKEAQAGLSEDQVSYIDEFTFYENGEVIEGWYAGDLLAVWQGQGWTLPTV